MIIQPKMRGFICTTSHPGGCRKNVEADAEYAGAQPALQGPKRVLVIGCSTGYGLACRLTAAFGCGADTVGVCLERPAAKGRTATAGWYNNLAFEELAKQAGLSCETINGDAYSDAAKERAIQAVKALPGGQADLVIYSLAAPKRIHPKTGETYSSVIKPLKEPFRGKTVDFHTGEVTEVEIAPASREEADATVQVMGGEDWLFWVEALQAADALAPGCCTVAFSYLGPVITHPIYSDGTIGRAKEDLEQKAAMIDRLLSSTGGKAYVSVNKALVTQASAAIPVVPLYISLLYRVMKEQGTHESCIQQMARMFQRIYSQGLPPRWGDVEVDSRGRIRMDDWEMKPEVQQRVQERWNRISTETLAELGDLGGYREDFYRLFGFGVPGVDYGADMEP